MFTYEIAPVSMDGKKSANNYQFKIEKTFVFFKVFILIEHATFAKMREIIGFKNGDSIMAPGKFGIFNTY